MSRWYSGNVTIKVYDWDGSHTEVALESSGFTDEEAQLIVDIYFKHCEHVSPEFRLDFARSLLDLVKEGKINVTPTKENKNVS